MNDLDQRIANLSPEKRALLEKRLMQREVENPSEEEMIPRLARRGAVHPFALSFAQQRLWFLDQLEPGSSSYNIPRAKRISGRLDIAALQNTLDALVARHESLRTTFTAADGDPMQLIAEPGSVTMPVIDLSGWLEAERKVEVMRLAVEEARRPFDLACGPLLRACLLRLGEEQHILLLNLHHIITDGWSMGILLSEIAALYEAFSAGRLSPLPELPIQYADFAEWQHRWLQGNVLESLVRYWKQQLTGAPAVLELPLAKPRPASQGNQGGRARLKLSKELGDQLKELSRRQGVTLFMVLLAAFQTLLFRYTQQDDIIVGSPIAGRNRMQTEKMVGLFINTLVLRTDLSGNPSFLELLRRVKEVTLGAYAHQEVPFEKLLEELQIERSLSYSPLFQVMFVLQNAPTKTTLKLSGLTLDSLRIDSRAAKFDLYLSMMDSAEGLKGSFTYRTDLFDAATITRMTGHFQALLEGIAAHPEQRLASLPLLTEAERHQLLMEWNDTPTDCPNLKCVHELFEEQAARTPEAVAVVFEDEQLSYAELNRRANRLAHQLRALGVSTEVLVGLYVERSLEMVVGLLGILKAGGAYLPLDPFYPKQRLALMLEDAKAPILLTQQKLASDLPAGGAEVICLDAPLPPFTLRQASLEQNPYRAAGAEHAAYVIYTSGSTGRPKGVLIEHKALSNYTEAATLAYEISARDRILQFASISFDAAAEEIFPCLTRGATLVLRPEHMLSSAAHFLQSCEDDDLTVLSLPTAYWHELTAGLAVDDLAIPRALRLVIIGGEKALPERVGAWRRRVRNEVRLINTYGPTEATVVTTLCALTDSPGADGAASEVPIGRPIHNVQTYVLDEHLQPVPIGMPGELHIGGAGLARGYLNQPELTAQKFIRNPFSEAPEARLYKTGDRVRYAPDGQLEYLGRIDQQVKVRGFRIELGEIEAALGQYPGVREAVVMAREDLPGEKRLVAYLTPYANLEIGLDGDNQQAAAQTSVSELHAFLKERLPEYMLPSAFVMLEALPLTPNGKLDRRALPAPEQSRPQLEASFMAPRTPVEELLAAIWAEVLKLEQIGVHDNFFELGGHSLLATQVISRVCAAFQIDMPLRTLFETPTVAGLAEAIVCGPDGGALPEEKEAFLEELGGLTKHQAELRFAGKM